MQFKTVKQAMNFMARNISVVSSPKSAKVKIEPSAPIRIEFSNELLESVIDIKMMWESFEWKGYIFDFYVREIPWGVIPENDRKELKGLLSRFSRAMREGKILIPRNGKGGRL